MKKTLLSITVITICGTLNAQTWATAALDINGVSAMAVSNGDLFWDYTGPGFEVPKGGQAHTIFAGALWVGGLDTSGQLHLGAQTYRQSGNDFYPGPVMNQANYSAANDALWNKVWKVNKSTIDSFRLGLFTSTPSVILDWPGNGDVSQGQAAQLAPYVDVDADGVYNPAVGDYPCIKGDQALFVIFNDDRNTHTETGGQKLGFEFHAMLYAYSAPGSWLDSVVYLNYKMYNRSGRSYNDAYIGSWTDFDLGFSGDDYIGCDVTRNIYYGYNGDVNDGTSALPTLGTYGANPPAQGVVFLRGPAANPGDGVDNNHDGVTDEAGEVWLMSKFVYYNNDFTVMGNPVTAGDYYNYMSGLWKDGSPVTYGGTGYGGLVVADYMFPGSSDPLGWGTNGVPQLPWDEASAGNTPHDRRGFGASGPFTITAGQVMCMDYAYVYARGNAGPLSGVAAMQSFSDSVRTFYETTSPCACATYPLAVDEQLQEFTVPFYPNPATSAITVTWQPQTAGAKLELYDMTGRMVHSETIVKKETTVSMEKLPAGIYLLRVTDGQRTGASKVLKQ